MFTFSPVLILFFYSLSVQKVHFYTHIWFSALVDPLLTNRMDYLDVLNNYLEVLYLNVIVKRVLNITFSTPKVDSVSQRKVDPYVGVKVYFKVQKLGSEFSDCKRRGTKTGKRKLIGLKMILSHTTL